MKKILGILLLAILMMSINAVAEIDFSGMTLEELLEVQEQLSAAIEIAQKSNQSESEQPEQETLEPIATAQETPSPTLEESVFRTLKRGDTGEDVLRLNQRLNALGYLSGEIQNKFTGKTKLAVKTFQKTVGLPNNGIADEKTQELLFSDEELPTPPPKPTPDPDFKPRYLSDATYGGLFTSKAESVAKDCLRSILKNPESLQIHNTSSVYENGQYTVFIDYSAQNGFGGYNRETFVCITNDLATNVISYYSY